MPNRNAHVLVGGDFNFSEFKTGFVEVVERFIPSKMTKNKILCALDRCNDPTACKTET